MSEKATAAAAFAVGGSACAAPVAANATSTADRAANRQVRSSAPRLQYSSRSTVGEGYCLLADAGGFVDPLYS
ncbi:hypothetical protein ABZ848_08295, partial [Streptomyces sp. NPDC047081]|uniref:hypothetical protein n=1 Tax=Streptomyces sp. NPDC047081 TaxID=3154706 RepID=UPI003407971B